MDPLDLPVTSEALTAFRSAWLDCIADYEKRRINSEGCLQSALYHHLVKRLPDDSFVVYAEAVVRLGEKAFAETNKKKIHVDLVVCRDNQVVMAIELKFVPRGEPEIAAAAKDVMSLSHISNRRYTQDRVEIEMPRFRSADADVLRLSILKERKLILASFCSDQAVWLTEEKLWGTCAPQTGYWANKTALPPNLGVALARASDNGRAEPFFFGGPFQRLELAV